METKSVRFELLMKPSVRKALKKLAKKQGVSSGQMVETLIQDQVRRQRLP